MDTIKELTDRLAGYRILDKEELRFLIGHVSKNEATYLYEKARDEALNNYGNGIFIRGLAGFTNYYKNDCYHCGICKGNPKTARYRLIPGQIMDCYQIGYGLGLRTFILQGGEDPQSTGEKIAYLVENMRKSYSDCAVVLSVGEKDLHTYKRWFDIGAGRYLLRHETTDPCHYASLHLPQMSSEHRKGCLRSLKAIGRQMGCGIMVGAPYQTMEHIVEDLEFMYSLQSEMMGIGPFIPYHDTPFKNRPAETLHQTLLLLTIIRLIPPSVLLPATTALGTIEENGREQGVMAGADMVMPNLPPVDIHEKYMPCDNKVSTGVEATTNISELERRMKTIGYEMVTDRDDYKKP